MGPVITRAMHMNRRLPTSVYRLYDEAGELLYIGLSQDVVRRLRQHSTMQPWWSQVHHHEAVEYPDRYSAQRAELAAIRSENPRYNVFVPRWAGAE